MLKVELSQLKPGKTPKKSKILLKFADLNKVFAFFLMALVPSEVCSFDDRDNDWW